MYSRNFYQDSNDQLNIPNNYDGTMFQDHENQHFEPNVPEVSFNEAQDAAVCNMSRGRENSMAEGFGRLPFLSGLFGRDGFLPGLNLKMPKIGTEEILILVTAAFLIFSKSGDRECGILLLLLLLVN